MAHIFEKKWRSKDVRLREKVDFSALLLNERVLEGLQKAGFKRPSPIQYEAIPVGNFGQDLIVQAKSGTGKTLVFAVIALEKLKRKLHRPQVLVIVPTREIATQVCSVIKAVGSGFPKLNCNSFIGGLPLVDDQEIALSTQIVVGTPGRLKQLIQLKSLPTNSIRLLVFDEADELLNNNSFKEDIEDIFSSLPDEKQVIATSATYSPKVKKILYRFLADPNIVRLNAKELALLGMVHYAEVVEFCPMPLILYRNKLQVLQKILKSIKFAQCLLFCNGIQRVEVLYKDVKRWGFSATYISSAKEQFDRLKAMERLKRFKCKVLVSSDLTARGIDAENVDLVINFDLSYTSEVYMHRVGRAGRYGSIGVAISIIDNQEMMHLQRIEKTGSFKTFKLPDPIPKDIILYPPEVDYLIDDTDSSEVKRIAALDDDELNDNGYDLENENDVENIKVKDILETSVDKDALSKLTIQNGEDGLESCDDDTVFSKESKMKGERIDENDHLKNKSIETIHFNGHVTDKNLKNTYICNDNIKQSENTNSVVRNCDQNQLVNCESIDKPCDTHGNPDALWDKTVLEIQNWENCIENNVQLINQVSNVNDNVEREGLEADGLNILTDIHIDNVPELSETEIILKNTEDASVSSVQESVDKSNNTLNNAIKAFMDTYESNKELESTFDKGSQLSSDSTKELITVDMINNLKSQKQEFFYKTLKKFQENKDGCSIAQRNETEGKKAKNVEDNSDPDLIDEDINVVLIKSEDNSKVNSKDDFPEKPNFESTPQISNKNMQEIVDQFCKLKTTQNKLEQLFQEFADESDSDDLESSEETNEVSKQNSAIDSKLDSSSSDSEGECDSETSSSLSESESSLDTSDSSSTSTISSGNEDESAYHHNYSRTGRQNPSLISDSMSDHLRNDRVYYDHYFPNRICACCGVPENYKPQQSTSKFSGMPRHSKRGCKTVDLSHHCEDSKGYFKRTACNPYESSNVITDSVCPEKCSSSRGAHRVPRSFIECHLPKKHSRCPKSKNSFSEARENQNRCDHLVCRRSSRHRHHTLNCFMPTEHRCHPNTPDYHCERGPLCEMWYRTFYNQWLHIQNVIH